MFLKCKDSMFLFVVLLLVRLAVQLGSHNVLSQSITGGDATQEEVVMKTGRQGCPCLTLGNGTIKSLDPRQADFLRDEQGKPFPFANDYGSTVCSSHDMGLTRFCNNSTDDEDGIKGWCADEWCWVDPNNCDARFHNSGYFPGSGLYFSYDTCDGPTNDTLTNSIRWVEGSARLIKTTLEAEAVSPPDESATCPPLPDCGDCRNCRWDECWARNVDTETTAITLPNGIRHHQLDALACTYNTLSKVFLNVSKSAENSETNILFEYFGHRSGVYLQRPSISDECPLNYDPRFRPWYFSALSGAKDIVIVIHVSDDKQAKLAAEAAKKVLGSLSWVDHFSVIILRNGKEEVFRRRSAEGWVEEAKNFIDQKISADSGIRATVLEVLQYAYELSSVKSGCSQSILFFSDGHGLDSEVQDIVQKDKNVVIFTYSLGQNAPGDNKLQELACRTNGIFYRIDSMESIPDAMAAYYDYFVQLQKDSCRVNWLKYKGVFTGKEFLSGCVPILDYGPVHQGKEPLPKILGVACVDINLIINPNVLEDCRRSRFSTFEALAREEAADCQRHVEEIDPWVLETLRKRANATCSSDALHYPEPTTPRVSECTNHDSSRFENNTSLGCPRPYLEPGCLENNTASPSREPSHPPFLQPSFAPSSEPSPKPSRKLSPWTIVGIVIAMLLTLGVLVRSSFCFHRRNSDTGAINSGAGTDGTDTSQEHTGTTAQGRNPKGEIDVFTEDDDSGPSRVLTAKNDDGENSSWDFTVKNDDGEDSSRAMTNEIN